MFDAELRSSHTAMYILTLALAAIYNRSSSGPLVYGTYQCYFKEMKRNLQQSLQLCKKLGTVCGAKIVRGAYMNHERRQASLKGFPDPIWPSYEDTSNSYNGVVEMLLRYLATGQFDVSIFVASHNSDSIVKATALMDQFGIPRNHECVKFAQIYGMCDHLSFALGRAGYTVYKSTPWGSVGEWLPYLSRRAAENHTAFKTTRNELPLYTAELKHRLFGK